MTVRINILGVGIDALSSHEVLSHLEKYIQGGGSHAIYITNSHTINLACRLPEYRRILNQGSLVLNDGAGMALAAFLKQRAFPENLVGTDLIPKILNLACAKGYKIFLLGGEPGLAGRSAGFIQAAYPNIRIAGVHHGYLNSGTNRQVVGRIQKAKPELLLVGMGNPMQEMWIHRHLRETRAAVAIGVGGIFKYYSGAMKRAPLRMRNMGLEWLYLLWADPRRSWPRYLLGHPAFITRALKDAIK